MSDETGAFDTGGAEEIRVLHISTGLGTGGAELVLSTVVRNLDRSVFQQHVVSLSDEGSIGVTIADNGIPVTALGLAYDHPNPLRILRLVRLIRSMRPHVVQTWMFHADLIGGLVARISTSAPVVWNLRQSDLDPALSRSSLRRIVRTNAMLSGFLPSVIVSGSHAAARLHTSEGYDDTNMQIIPNGFDTERFRPDPESRSAFRTFLGIDADEPLVGMIARYHPQKDHPAFIAAAARIHAQNPRVRFVLAGRDIDDGNGELMSLLSRTGMTQCFHLLGEMSDVSRVYHGLDLAVLSSSFAEGSPNVIGEAMASGVPCVATDIGDSALLIGDCGAVVPPREPERLAGAVTAFLDKPESVRRAAGEAARSRIRELFSVNRMVGRYDLLYRRLYAQRHFEGRLAAQF